MNWNGKYLDVPSSESQRHQPVPWIMHCANERILLATVNWTIKRTNKQTIFDWSFILFTVNWTIKRTNKQIFGWSFILFTVNWTIKRTNKQYLIDHLFYLHFTKMNSYAKNTNCNNGFLLRYLNVKVRKYLVRKILFVIELYMRSSDNFN